MEISISYKLGPIEALRGYRAFHLVRRRVIFAIAFALTAVCVLVGTMARELWLPLLGVFYGVVLCAIPELTLRRAVKKQRHLLGHVIRLVFTPDQIESSSALGESKLNWNVFRRVMRRKGFWLFCLSPYQAIMVPETAVSAGEARELERFLVSRNLMRN